MKKIFFDLDDTILDFHAAEALAIRSAFKELQIAADDGVIRRYSQINAEQWRLLEAGKATREQVLTNRFAILFKELGSDCSPAKARDTYEEHLSRGHIFMPWAPELLEALYGRYELYLASNGTAKVQAGRLRSAGIEHYFNGIFISENIGYNKPSPEFFRRCFAGIHDFVHEDALMVGDSLTSDILGGTNAGIRTCWFNPNGAPETEGIRADYEISSLRQLPGLLEEIFPVRQVAE